MHGSIAPMHGRGCSHAWEGCSHGWEHRSHAWEGVLPWMGGGAPIHGSAVLPCMGAVLPWAWERCSHHGSTALHTHGSGLPHAWEPCSHVMGARAPMAWEQVQNVGEALPWGADMGALLDPLPCKIVPPQTEDQGMCEACSTPKMNSFN